MSLKTMLLKKMLASKLKGVPEAEVDKLLNAIEKNPDLFKKMGEEIQVLMKQGKDQTSATMQVAQKYQEELKKIV